MYFLDPTHGRRRRTAVSDHAGPLARKTGNSLGALSRQVTNQWPAIRDRASSVARGVTPTRAVAGAGAIAGLTAAAVVMSRRSQSRTAKGVNGRENWDPAGFA